MTIEPTKKSAVRSVSLDPKTQDIINRKEQDSLQKGEFFNFSIYIRKLITAAESNEL